MLLPELITRLLLTFDELGIPYLVGGSYASSTWGQPRQTHDIDLSVYLYAAHVDELVARVADEFMISRLEIEDALESDDDYRTFQMIHFEETFKVDCFLRDRAVEYESACLDRGIRVKTSPTYEALFMSPEDIVITKLRWYELGNRVSDRQWNDIVQVLEVRKGVLDLAYLHRWADHFAVRELFEEAYAQTLN